MKGGKGVLTKKERLKDVKETKQVIQSRQKHYSRLLKHFDDDIEFINNQIAKHDEETTRLQERKNLLAAQLAEAPEKLVQLAQDMKRISEKEYIIRHGDTKERRIGRLKKRMTTLKQQLANLEKELSEEDLTSV